MKYSNTIEYNISTKLDASGLTKFQAELQKIELSLQNKANRQLLPAGEVEKAREQLNGLSQALTKAFNPSLGIIDLSKLRSSLGDSAVNAKSLSQAFKLAGTDGEVAFNNLLNQLGRFDSGIARSNSSLDKLYTTMSNTFRWGLVSSFFSQFMNGIHSSIDYVKDLDESLTQIMLVTDYNRDSMNEYAKSANEAAKALSMSTTGMTNASLVFAQQGFDLSQSQQLAELSAKLANASQQDTATTSDQITAYMNAYGLEDSIEELTQQMDNWALIANVSAADVGELAQASQRAASMANAVGVSGEQLAAQIATIESVTREAPEQIGNGLKTLYARFSDIAAGKEDEDGFTLGKVTSELQKIGVQVLDSMGQIRDVGDIMEDLMVIWDDLDQTSKVAASQALAGKYQVNRFMALMDNTEMYQEYKGATGNAATGTLDQMNEEYAQSLAGRVQKLQTTLEGIFNNLFDTDDFYKFIDVAQTALDLIDNLTEAMGGGIPVLTALVGLMTQAFSKNMAQEITRNAQNRELDKIRVQNAENVGGIISQLGLENAPSEASQGIVNFVQQGAQNYSSMSTEQVQQYNQILNDQVAAANRAAEANKNLANTIAEVGAAAGIGLNAPDAIFQGEEGEVNTSNLIDVIRNTGKEDFSQIKPEDFTDAAKEAESFANALVEVEDVFERFKNSDAEGNIDKLATAIEYARDKLITLHESGAISDDTFERMSNTLDNAASHMENWDSEAENAIDDMYKLSLEAIDLNEILQGLASGKINWDNLDKSVQQAVLEVQNARAVVEGTQSMGQAFFDGINTQKMTQGFLDIVGATTSLISAFTTLKNLGSIWNNEDLSMTEKITQTILNLGSAILTIIPAITNLKNGWKDLQVQELLTNAATLKTNVSTLLSATAIERENLVIGSNIIAKKADIKTTIEAKAAELGLSGASVKLATVMASLNPILLAVGAAAAIIAGLTFKHLWDEAEKADAQAEALKAINEQINETANTVKESAPKLNELYDEFIKTGKASDEFITALEEQAKALGINNEEILIASENYITLKGEVDRATESILAANSALLQLDLEKADSKTLVNELSDDQKERYNLTYHQEEGITGYSAGTPVKGNINVLDQTPYEIVQAAQKDIEIQQERINELTAKRNQLIKDGAAISSDEVLEIDNALSVAAKALSESKAYVEEHKNILEDVQGIINNTLDRELINPNSIFKSGSFEEIKDFISSLGLEGVDTSNIDDFVIKYANLAGNIEAAADAQLDFITNQVRESGNGLHALGLIGNLGNEFNLSDTDKVKITQLFDWNDPEIDIKVDDIAVKIQEGLEKGLSLDQVLENIKNQVSSLNIEDLIPEMKPIDSDLEVGPYQEMARYLVEVAGVMEGIPQQVAENADMLQDFTEAILRYDDALHDADENLEDWKKLLTNAGEAAEDDAVYLEDLMEAFEGMRDMLGDLLDMDVSNLSHDFMQNADVLEILDKAIYGVGEEADLAYDQLDYLAKLDMAGLIDWTDGIDDELLAWENAIPSLESNLSSLSDTAVELGDNAVYAMDIVEQVLSGEIPGPELNLENFVQGLEDMVNSGEMGLDEALAAMDGAGVSADVVQEDIEGADVEGHVSATPIQTEGITIEDVITGATAGGGMAPASLASAASSVKFSGQVHGVDWTFDKATEEASTNTPVTGVKYKAGKGGGAGDIHFTNVHRSPSGSTKRGAATGGGGHPRSGGGGKGGGSCFIAGTLISMKESSKFIEDIQIGDFVLSYNETTKTNEYSKVLQTMIHDTTEEIYDLYIEDEILSVTGIHRFYIRRKHEIQWIMASDLKIGDYVLLANGTWQPIWKIKVKIQTLTVYNFEVSYNHNYYVGKSQILAHNKGGGGGGGKAKTIQPKEKKKHEKDYYEEVDSQLKKTESILSKIEGENDRLTGDKARANYDKQIKLLQKEIKLQQQKLKIMQDQELTDVDKSLTDSDKQAEKILKDAGITFEIPDIELDEDGIVSNYEDISEALDEGHNKLIDEYNKAAKAGDEERAKAIEEQIKKYDEWAAKILEDARRHDELQGEIEDTKKTLEDLEDSIEDIAIAVYQASQEAIDNLKDLREGWAEMEGFFSGLELDSPFRDLIEDGYKLDEIYTADKGAMEDYYDALIDKEKQVIATSEDEDEIAAAQRNVQFYEGQKANLKEGSDLGNGLLGLAQQDLERLTEWMNNPEDPSNPFGKNTKALEEAHAAAYERVREMTLEYEKWVAEYRDDLIAAYDDIYDRQMEVAEKYDDVVDDLERAAKAYTLYYGDDAYGAMSAMEQAQGDAYAAQAATYQEDAARWHEEMLKYYDEEGNLREDANEEVAKEVKKHWEESEKAAKEASLNSAEYYRKSFEHAIDETVKYAKDAFSQQIDVGFGQGMAWDDLNQTWERQKDYGSRYKDDVEKAYEVDKLRMNYMDLLDSAQNSSLGIQRKIRQQMEEQVNLLENQTTMSQYDVDLANAKYNILQKQIALEEAQQNKNQMKLRRDAQGNYSYVYTANQDDVRNAQRDLMDTEYDAYEMTKSASIENTDRALNEWQNYWEQRAEIERKYSAEDEKTMAKREAALAALDTQWEKTKNALTEDFEDVHAGLVDILEFMIEDSTANTTEMLEALKTNNYTALNSMGEDWATWGDQIKNVFTNEETGVETIMHNAEEKMASDWQTYSDKMDSVIGNITGSIDSYNQYIDSAKTKTDDLKTAQEELNAALVADWTAANTARERLAQYEKELTKAKNSMSNLRQALQAAYEARDQAEAAKLNAETILDDIRKGKRDKNGNLVDSEEEGKGANDPLNPKGKDKKEKLKESIIKEVYEKIDSGQVGNGSDRTAALRAKGYSDRYIAAGQYVINHVYDLERRGYGDMALDQAIKDAAAKFKTGGYTGTWKTSNGLADQGRLAVLHQKELVLNQKDTENILEAVKYMRELSTSQLDSSSMVTQIMKGISQYIQGDTIEQRVEITATFPNVNTAKEIEIALLGISDKAYQYAHKNKLRSLLNY